MTYSVRPPHFLSYATIPAQTEESTEQTHPWTSVPLVAPLVLLAIIALLAPLRCLDGERRQMFTPIHLSLAPLFLPPFCLPHLSCRDRAADKIRFPHQYADILILHRKIDPVVSSPLRFMKRQQHFQGCVSISSS